MHNDVLSIIFQDARSKPRAALILIFLHSTVTILFNTDTLTPGLCITDYPSIKVIIIQVPTLSLSQKPSIHGSVSQHIHIPKQAHQRHPLSNSPHAKHMGQRFLIPIPFFVHHGVSSTFFIRHRTSLLHTSIVKLVPTAMQC